MTFVCDKAFETQSRGLMERANVPVTVRTITAGKFRRYAHLAWWRQLLIPQILFPNIADVFNVLAGTVQSCVLIARLKPDVMFAKGGFVCLPVGMAARVLRVPLVIHDSDTRPGMTNKVLARWAAAIATGFPVENYSYDTAITTYTGVPIAAEFAPVMAVKQRAAKATLGFDAETPLVVVTGGGLGARSINTATVAMAPDVLADGAAIYHITGKGHYDAVAAAAPSDDCYKIVPFVYHDMVSVLGAADVVVARGSATFLQELAGIGKAVIVVPARQLGDQLKNAAMYQAAGAACVLQDSEIEVPGALRNAVFELLGDTARRERLADALHAFARPQAAADVASLIRTVRGH